MRSLLKPIFAATASVADLRNPRWWTGNGLTSRTFTGVDVSPETAMALSAHYACLRNVSEDVGGLPLKVYRSLSPRGKEPLPGHPVWRLLQSEPNEFMSAIVFREMLTHWMMGWGNGYAEIVRSGGRGEPKALFPIHPSRVVVKRDASTGHRLEYHVHTNDGTTIVFQQRDIFHLRGLGGDLVGYSVVQLGAEAIGRGLAVQQYASTFFANSSTPTGAFKTPESLDDKARQHLKDTWPKGLIEAHNPLFLEGGMEWQSMSINPKDAQMIDTAKFSVIDICRFHRVPPHKVMSLENATFTNIEHQGHDYVIDGLLPKCNRWEQEVARKLLAGESDVFAKHSVNALLRGDSAARADFYTKMHLIGAMSPNDALDFEDMNPIEGGDTYYRQANLVPINGEDDESEETESEQTPAPQRPNRFESIKKAHMRTFVDASERIVRKEVMAISRADKRCVEDVEAFGDWVDKFYTEHEDFVFDVLWPNVSCLAELVMYDVAQGQDFVDCNAARDRLDGMLRVFATQHCETARGSVHASVVQDRVIANCKMWEVAVPGNMATDLTDQTAATVRAVVCEVTA